LCRRVNVPVNMQYADDNNSDGSRDTLRAKFVFDGKRYDIIDLSNEGMLIECAEGFPAEMIRKLSGGSFVFGLLDSATDSEMELAGDFVRAEGAETGGRVIRIWIVQQEKQLRRSETQSARPVARVRRGKTVAVGGGKGGVGKTIIAVNLALSLAQLLHKKVTLLDGDFGNSNCNILLGITRVENSLEEYLRNKQSLEDVTVPTAYDNVRLVCGAQNKVDGLLTTEMPRLLADIGLIDADCLVIDLGSGMGDETIELYQIADEKIIVATPQVTALQNAYGFVKSAFFYDLERTEELSTYLDRTGIDPQKLYALIGSLPFDHVAHRAFVLVLARQRFRIIGNMVNSDKDLKIVQNLQKVVEHYLHIESTILGTLGTSEDIPNSINRITPFVVLYPDSKYSQEMKSMAVRMMRG